MSEDTWHTQDLLKKPIQIDSFTWSTAVAQGATIRTYDLPQIINAKNSLHNIALRVFCFFRMDFILRFQLNTTPFHLGRIIVAFDPFNQFSGSTANSARKFFNTYSATGNPSVLLDASSSNVAELRIPFKHIQNFLSTNSSNNNDTMGKVYVAVLNQLGAATGVTSSVQVVTYLYASDPTLHVPIYEHAAQIPTISSSHVLKHQPGYPHVSGEKVLPDVVQEPVQPVLTRPPVLPPIIFDHLKHTHVGDEVYEKRMYTRPDGFKVFYAVRVGYDMDERAQMDLEAIMDSDRFASEHTHGMAAVDDPSTGIVRPLKSSEQALLAATSEDLQAQGLDIALEKGGAALGQAASSIYNLFTGNFGAAKKSGSAAFSSASSAVSNLDKPTHPIGHVLSGIPPVAPLAHGKGVDSSIRLALDPLSTYSISPEILATSADEMNVDFIVRNKMMIDQLNWNATHAQGTLLTTIPVAPGVAHWEEKTVIGPPPTVLHRKFNTFLSYVAALFQYWRGPISYRFDFVCSKFHTGRLLVAFVPNTPTVLPDFSSASSCPFVVFDLQQKHSFDFTVPWESSTPFKEYHDHHPVPSGTQVEDRHVIGYLFVYVQNPLAAPDNVPSSIGLNIYSGAGEGFQFAVPRNYSNRQPEGDNNSIFWDTRWSSLTGPVPLTDQGLDFTGDVVTRSEEFSTLHTSKQLTAGSFTTPFNGCFGESFSDLRDLIRRYNVLQEGQFAVTQANPRARHIYTVHPSLRGLNNTGFVVNNLMYVSRMFACWHGSMRFKMLFRVSRDDPCTAEAYHLLYTHSPDYTAGGGQVVGGSARWAASVTNPGQDSALELEVPFYSIYTQLLTENGGVYDDRARNVGRLAFQYTKGHTGTGPIPDGVAEYELYSAAGDDFGFSYLVAPPVTYGEMVPQN